MEVILSHNNTDLDGLASMVAAKKLHPGAEMIFVGRQTRTVQEFMALHRDSLPIKEAKGFPVHRVKRVILCDTKTPSRLGPFQKVVEKPETEIIIYDHHPASDDDVRGSVEVIEATGATTTLLVELLREKGIDLTPFEATVIALGIYEDTNGLTFPTTTPRDAAAVAFLLEKGANLTVISDFIERPLSDEQKNLLTTLMRAARRYDINGVQVLITEGVVEDFIEGLALLVHKISEMEALDVIFALVRMDDRIHLVARSRIDTVKVNEFARLFGGGGHEKAASASIRETDLEKVTGQLLAALRENIRPRIVAREMMSSPVKTVGPDLPLEEAGKIMLRYGHSGLPVVDGERMVGVISRRDIEKARHHGLGHAPVKGFMSREVVSIGPNAPLHEIQKLMIKKNIGRLPVLEQGKLVGIVSRTDVLRTLHGEDAPKSFRTFYHPVDPTHKDLLSLMEKNLPARVQELLADAGWLGDRLGVPVYVVGGFVRDLFLGVPNLDVDLVVEGDGIAFAEELASHWGARLKTHEKFGTALVLLDDMKIDVATARTEFYEYPAALPQVERSNLRQDLYRRDFTINAMAIELNGPRRGKLVDFFGGREDLEAGIVRVLYNLSFIEDPTRILRAVRFEQRYGFVMESQTLNFAKHAIEHHLLGELSYERIWDELVLILQEKDPLPALRRLDELGIWGYLMPELAVTPIPWQRLEKGARLAERAKAWIQPEEYRLWLVYLLCLLLDLTPEGARGVVHRYHLPRKEGDALLFTVEEGRNLRELLKGWDNTLPSRRAEILIPWPVEGILAQFSAGGEEELLRRVLEFRRFARATKAEVDGNDLRSMGIVPGPVYRDIIQALRRLRLDGKVHTRREEIDWVRKHLKEFIGERGSSGVRF